MEKTLHRKGENMKKIYFLIVSIGSILALLGSCAKDDDAASTDNTTSTTTATFTSTTTASGSITVGSVAMSGVYASTCYSGSEVASAVSGGYFPSDVKAVRDVLVVTGNDNISEESHYYTDTTCSNLSTSLKDGNDNFTVGDASGEFYKVTYKETGFKVTAGTTVAETYYENYFSTNNITASGTTIDLVVDTEYDVGGDGYTEMNIFYVSSTIVRHGDDDNATQPTEMDTLEMAKQ